MRRTIAVIHVILGVLITFSAHSAGESLTFLHGEWTGTGTISGRPASIRHVWAPTLNRQFTNLKLGNRMTGSDGLQVEFEGTGFYRETADQVLEGFWVDSGGDMLPLRATVNDQTLTAIWGSEDTKLGRSIYQMLPDGTLLSVDSIKKSDGEWHEFGRVILNRKPTEKGSKTMARVTGIGGVFLKARSDAGALSSWYQEHLGMNLTDFGGVILQWEEDIAEDKGITVWHVAEPETEWFNPSNSTFMINYRVDDLEALLEQFRSSGVDILKGPEYHENGVFAWIMDPEGNKVELWEPKIWDDANKK